MYTQVVELSEEGIPTLAIVGSLSDALDSAVPTTAHEFVNGATGKSGRISMKEGAGRVLKGATSLYFYRYGFASHSKFHGSQEITQEYGATGCWKRPVCSMMCLNRKCTLQYDGEEDGLFRWSKITTICQTVLRLYEGQMLGSSATFQGYCNQVQHQYTSHGCPTDFIGQHTFATAHYAFVATKPQVVPFKIDLLS
jgi:hypothetical protein